MALSKDTPLPVEVGNGGFIGSIPAAAVRIYDGAAVGANSSGYGRGFTLGDTFRGHAIGGVDNSAGSAGDKNCSIRRGRYCLEVPISNVAITDAMKSAPVYLTSDNGYSLRVGLLVGCVVRYVRSGYAIVEFDTEKQIQCLSETVIKSDFTDGGSTSGYKDFATQLPAGVQVLGVQYDVKTGFTGDTTAVAQVGKSGSTACFTADTSQSVLAAGVKGSAAPVATQYVVSATTVRVTVTGGADFTAIASGAEMDVKVFFAAPGRQ